MIGAERSELRRAAASAHGSSNSVEQIGEGALTEILDRNDDHQDDQGADEPVFDRCRASIVTHHRVQYGEHEPNSRKDDLGRGDRYHYARIFRSKIVSIKGKNAGASLENRRKIWLFLTDFRKS